jgi:hypothetical protein
LPLGLNISAAILAGEVIDQSGDVAQCHVDIAASDRLCRVIVSTIQQPSPIWRER